jgi:hypothetical protein
MIMVKPYKGGCACGAIRYQVSGELLVMVDCQCRQCQRASGTGHASYLTFKDAAVEVLGTPSRWNATGDGGTVKASAFCPTCGTPVFMRFPAMPALFAIRAASLDEPERYRPQMVVWSDAGQAWDHMDPGLPNFPRMPPSA